MWASPPETLDRITLMVSSEEAWGEGPTPRKAAVEVRAEAISHESWEGPDAEEGGDAREGPPRRRGEVVEREDV